MGKEGKLNGRQIQSKAASLYLDDIMGVEQFVLSIWSTEKLVVVLQKMFVKKRIADVAAA